jgi:parallel beta-helix repeat protein
MQHICTSIVATLALAGTSLAATINVPGDYTTIQAAVVAASDGDEIIVAPGTYTGTGVEVVNMLGKAIAVKASGTPEETILDGQGARRVLVCNSGETPMTLIEGFTITDGFTSADGGGIHCGGSSPSIVGCTITGNETLDKGGGISLHESSPSISGCTISNNTSVYGGGIHCFRGMPMVDGCVIQGNSASDNGGGIFCAQVGKAVLSNCIFEDNVSNNSGGGLLIGDGSSPTLDHCLLRSNDCTWGGGGGAFCADNSSPLFTYCIISDNQVPEDQGGGLYCINGANSILDHCVISNNNGAEGGGGLLSSASTPELNDTFVCSNSVNQIQGNWTDNGGNTIEEVCTDTDGDGIPDELDNCDLYNPDQADCNDNGIGDVCDVADQTSYDCNQNGIPDECESDCDGDGVIDDCDNDGDFDGDGIPDNCETDCNGNTIPDHFEIEQGWVPDCNGNGVPDECDLWDSAYDCDDNGAIDSCEIADDPGLDCDGNGTLDACEPLDDTTDCDGNGLLDICEIAVDPDLDCDGSGVLDTCEFVYWYTMRTKPLASDGVAGDNFGYGIGVEGNVALVSARYDGDNGDQSGSVYVFERQLDGQWSETGKFSGSDTTAGDTFGVGVSLDGDLAAISAPFDDGQGSVYIFQRQADGSWSQVDKILAPEGTVDAAFGTDVSLNGNRLLIGAGTDDDLANNAGSAFIYERSESGDWVQQAKLLASDGDGWHYFGVGVALSGDRAMVGAPKYDGDTGVVYEFQRQEDGSWNELGKIGASNGTNGDVYGGSIALEDNRLFVNSYREQGFLYVYDRDSAGEWIEVDILPGPDTGDNEGFGYDVALDGNQLLAGAHGDSNENGEGAGSFYIFQRTSKLDCDANGVVDSCEMADDPSLDCDSDGILDSCAFAEGLVEDCDQDGLIDTCEIADDPLLDQNNNGLLDQCECLADIAGGGEPGDGDGVVDVNDVLAVIGFWGSAGPIGDIDFDGVVGVNDLLFVLSAWGPCP